MTIPYNTSIEGQSPPPAQSLEELKNQLQGIAINKNYLENLVAAKISQWVFGLKGPWQIIVATILVEIINQCSAPDRQSRAIVSAALSRDNDLLPSMPSVKSIQLPANAEKAGAKFERKTVSAGASNVNADLKLLIIPYDQVVTVKWNAIGHAAICHEDIARVEIFGNKNGQIFRPFVREAHGVSRFPNSENKTDAGVTQLTLPAGGYIVRALSAGDFSGCSISVEYTDINVPIRPKIDLTKVAVIAGGAILVIGGIYLFTKSKGV